MKEKNVKVAVDMVKALGIEIAKHFAPVPQQLKNNIMKKTSGEWILPSCCGPSCLCRR